MNTTLKLVLGKFYRSRDGRVWEVVNSIPESYKPENSTSTVRNSIYPVIAVCHTSKTFGSYTNDGKNHLIHNTQKEDLVEEIENSKTYLEKLKDFKKMNEKRFVRCDGRLLCVDSDNIVTTFLYEELPEEIQDMTGEKTYSIGTEMKNFTYEDYCKFYGIKPVYEKEQNRKERFEAFLKHDKNFEFLGCQKENYTKILTSFFNFYELIEGQKMKENFFSELMLKMNNDGGIDENSFNVSREEKNKLKEFFKQFRSILKAEK
jgi:hypothetical protein